MYVILLYALGLIPLKYKTACNIQYDLVLVVDGEVHTHTILCGLEDEKMKIETI